MQHVKDTRALLDTAVRERQPIQPDPQLYPVKSDPARAWLRLNEVTIPPDAPVQSQTDPVSRAAFDLLRSRLLRQTRRDGIRKIALTSPTQGCGTTSTAANLALSLSRQIDLKIMLFDFNLRAPMLADRFGWAQIAPRKTALSSQRREFDSTCMRVGHNFGLSLTTQPETNPAELLGTSRSKALIEQIEREFDPDLMIFDLPPVLLNDDTVAAADLFDAALMVTRADHSTINEIDRAERLVAEQKPCLGIIMNACKFPAQSELGNDVL